MVEKINPFQLAVCLPGLAAVWSDGVWDWSDVHVLPAQEPAAGRGAERGPSPRGQNIRKCGAFFWGNGLFSGKRFLMIFFTLNASFRALNSYVIKSQIINTDQTDCYLYNSNYISIYIWLWESSKYLVKPSYSCFVTSYTLISTLTLHNSWFSYSKPPQSHYYHVFVEVYIKLSHESIVILYLSVLRQKIIQSYEYTDVLHTSPAINSIMLIVGDVAKGTKYMFTTNQVTHMGVTVQAAVTSFYFMGSKFCGLGWWRCSWTLAFMDFKFFSKSINISMES